MVNDHRWWQRGVIYQVYPRSFQDSSGDGVGDLGGIRRRLDYLHWLGVDAIWLSPIYPSPMADFGYDVADYTAVDPLFGSLADFDALVADLHAREMQLILDFVPNHSSDHHPWFAEARASRNNPRRDWYIWRDPAPDGGPPNAWQGAFGGRAWEFDGRTGQYYFHSFLKEQPDLDWRNPEVRAAMANVLRFWLRRGVDGFRIDVVWLLSKGVELELDWAGKQEGIGGDQRDVHGYIAELRSVAREFDDALLIGELYLPLERLMTYYGAGAGGLQLPYNFALIEQPWNAGVLEPLIARYDGYLPEGAWPNWVLGNHDNPRIASRVGAAQARVAVMLLLTLRGTPTIYYCDEIGMADCAIGPAEQRDPQGLRGGRSRDPQRTPMRWDGSVGAGFTDATPWLPMGPAAATINVAAQRDDPASMLSLHRRLLAMRRQEPALSVGEFRSLGRAGDTLAYLRTDGPRRFVVALNLGAAPNTIEVGRGGRVVISTHPEREARPVESRVGLLAHEGVVVSIGD
ncbi:alpha-amylase family glycosyl hydrolase [soil metagenome]